MMWLDILALIIIIGFALAGASMGGTRQLFRLGAAVAAVIFAPMGARLLAGPLAATVPELPVVAITGISLICAAILIYLVFTLIARLITDVIIKSSTILTMADQALGLGLGMVTAAVLLLVVGYGLLAIQPSLADLSFDDSRYLAVVQTFPVRDLLQLAHIETNLL